MEALTKSFLLEHGWEQRPESSYTKEEIEEGYVDHRLYITSPYAAVCGQWCHQSVACRDPLTGGWRLNISNYTGISNNHYRPCNLDVVVLNVEEYIRVMEFCKTFN